MRRMRCVAATMLLTAGGAVQAADDPTQADIDELMHRMDMMPEVYGQLSLALEHNETRVDQGSETSFRDNHSWIGIRNRTEIMPGTEAFVRGEWSSMPTDEDGMTDNLEYAYLGVEGDFGRVWGGTDDSVYEQELDYIANFFEGEFRDEDGNVLRHFKGPYDTGRDRLIQYRSPAYGNWRFHGAVQLNEDGNEDVEQGTAKESRPYQFITTYKSGSWIWALGMDSNDGDSTARLGERNNENTYGFRGSYQGERWTLTAQYQHRDDIRNVGSLLTTYTIGSTRFSVAWERERDDTQLDTETRTAYTAQILNNVNESMAVYVEGYQLESDGMTPMRRDLIIGSRYRF
mgnify:FL=1